MTAPAEEDGDGAATRGHEALIKFASSSSAKAGTLSEEVTLTEELEGIIKGLAENGAADCYPWDSLRILLAAKLEKVLADFWREVPDLHLREGETFDAAVEPLTRSLLEPRREGAPWTTQRLCELLAEPKSGYKSTRKYIYALQRAILITTTEEAFALRPSLTPRSYFEGKAAEMEGRPETCGVAPAAPKDPEGTAVALDQEESTPAGRKRKLPEELANGVVEE